MIDALCHNPWPGSPSMISGLWWCIMTSKTQDSRPHVSTEHFWSREAKSWFYWGTSVLCLTGRNWDKIKSHSSSQTALLHLVAWICFSNLVKYSQVTRNESLLLRLCNVNFYSALKVNSCSSWVWLFIIDDICLSLKLGQQIISLMYNTWAS